MVGVVAGAVLLLSGVQALTQPGIEYQPQPIGQHLEAGLLEDAPKPVKNFTDSDFDAGVPFNSSVYHGPTGVYQAHAQGLRGKGVRVAVIDTGIDNYHPALEGKIVYQHDFVGSPFGFGDAPHPGPSAQTNCSTHGTATASTIAGEDKLNGFVGVAPDAVLDVYKISGCSSDVRSLSEKAIIDALKLAISRQPDIISLSFGGGAGPYNNDTAYTQAIAAAAANDKILVVLSEGNDGFNGSFSSTESNAAPNVLYAGASNPIDAIPTSWPRGELLSNTERSEDFGYRLTSSVEPDFPEGEIPLCPLTLDLSDQDVACQPLKKPEQDWSKCVVVARQGSHCDIKTQCQHIHDQGGRMLLLYANGTVGNGEPLVLGAGAAFFPNLAGISHSTGEKILKRAKNGEKLSIKFDPRLKNKLYGHLLRPNNLFNGGVAFFSTWGPNGDLSNTPSMLTPGLWWGAIPTNYGGYSVVGGTSFSAPYLAGAAALIKSRFPESKPSEIRRRLTLTAKPLKFKDGTNTTYLALDTVFRQGSGQLDMMAALSVETDVTTESISFNDTQYFKEQVSFDICNRGKDAAEYRVGSTPAQTFTAYSAQDLSYYAPWNKDLSMSALPADKNFLSTMVPEVASIWTDLASGTTLAPGKCKSVTVKADISALKHLEQRCPLYSGYITVNTNRSEALTLPYSGVACRMNDHSPLPVDDRQTFLSSQTLRRSNGAGQTADETVFANPIESGQKFTVPKLPPASIDANKDRWNDNVTQYPVLVISPATYTRYDEWSVIPSSKNLTREEAKNATAYLIKLASTSSDPGGDNVGGASIVRQGMAPWSGLLKNGSFADPGSYVFRYCCARFWSSNRHDECITTVPFELAYK